MANASTLENMSPQLLRVVKRAQREPEGRFHSLAHLIDVPALERAYRRMRNDAAAGLDGVTKEQYGQELEVNLRDLHARLKAKQYRHQPIRRVHIPKEGGQTRPIGVSTFEDKLVQDALREALEAIYEQDFLDCSYGFRPGRSPHDAVRTLDRIVHRGKVNWILEADIVSCLRQPGSQPAEEDARGSGGRWVASPTHREVLACGRAGRRGDVHARVRHRPGVGALPVAGRGS